MFDRKISDMHAWVEERLSVYMDNQLAPDERAQVEIHLRDCARCQASLESLRWTLSLLKQVPAPALARSFALPVARKESRESGYGFAFLRMATALATLLLCLVVGLDLFSQSRFGAAPAPAPAAQFAAPTQNVALAPAVAATPAPTSAPAATMAPPPALSQPVALPTATRALSMGAAEVQATQVPADSVQKSTAPSPTQPFALRALITPTVTVLVPAPAQPAGPSGAIPPSVTLLSPTATQPLAPRAAFTATVALPSPAPTQPPPTPPVPSATDTPVAEARTQPTREAFPSSVGTARPEIPIFRLVEIGLLALAVALGALTIVVWRRR